MCCVKLNIKVIITYYPNVCSQQKCDSKFYFGKVYRERLVDGMRKCCGKILCLKVNKMQVFILYGRRRIDGYSSKKTRSL